MLEIKTEFDKRLSRNINKIKKAVNDLEKDGLKLYVEQVETLYGSLVDNVYIRDLLGEKVVLQKHLFTIK